MTTKLWAGHKSLDIIRAQCAAQGVPLNTVLYDNEGFDTVVVGIQKPGQGYVIYNTCNGRFFGSTPDGTVIDSDRATHDKTAWMQALLAFFLVPKAPRVPKAKA